MANDELDLVKIMKYRAKDGLEGVIRFVLQTGRLRDRSLTIRIDNRTDLLFLKMNPEDVEFYPKRPDPNKLLNKISISGRFLGTDVQIGPRDNIEIHSSESSHVFTIKQLSRDEGRLTIGFPFDDLKIDRIIKEKPSLKVRISLSNNPDEIEDSIDLFGFVKENDRSIKLNSFKKKRKTKKKTKSAKKRKRPQQSVCLCKKSKREPVERKTSAHAKKITYNSLIPSACEMNSLQATLVQCKGIPEGDIKLHFHPGDELQFLLSGEIRVEMLNPEDPQSTMTFELTGEKDVEDYLYKYNSLRFPAHIPHGSLNCRDESQLLVVYHMQKKRIARNLQKFANKDGITTYVRESLDLNNVISGFGCNLRLYMERRKMNVKELSRQIDASESDILAWLRLGKEQPEATTMEKIKQVLGIEFPIALDYDTNSYTKMNTKWAETKWESWDDRRTDHNDRKQICCLLEEPGSSEMQAILMKFKPTSKDMAPFATHSGEEFVFVRTGNLNIITIEERLTGMTVKDLQSLFETDCIKYGDAMRKLKDAGLKGAHTKMHTLTEGDSLYLNSNIYHAAYTPKTNRHAKAATVLTVHFDETRKQKTIKVNERSRNAD